MYKILFKASVFCAVFAGVSLFAEEANEKTAAQPDIAKLSESFGHLIAKNISNMGLKFDLQYVIKGLQDSSSGKTAPLTEAECIQAITSAQEAAFKSTATENLKKAEEFMAKNIKSKGVQILQKGKLHFTREQEGTGAAIQQHFSPLIRYVGKFMDGTVFAQSQEEELIALDETIPGLKEGLLGMKEGEKRTFYIHPELGYGTHGYLPPNSLLTFEIEIVKANAINPKAEIATPAATAQAEQAVREAQNEKVR